ncbi:hypothetical protein PG985_009852 [Apiospora marii]|uniref:Uncharacterized protein n=1 Tax=Apiospora marii TaxID=335849 RepID=A0ABR1RRL3_9PEZI
MNITGNAVVFGGGGGIGRSTAVAFARSNASAVIIADLNFKAAEDAAAEAKRVATNPKFRAEALQVDVTAQDSVYSVFQQVTTSIGRIDYCVTCAGCAFKAARPTADADVADFLRLQDINLKGAFFVVRAACAIMRSQDLVPNLAESEARGKTRGTITTLGSVLSFGATPQMMPYTASKHTVLGITKTAALDHAKDGIRVNCVCPTWVDTEMTKQACRDVPGMQETLAPSVPLGRIASPDEIADAILFLSSPRASFVTGCSFIIDGGTSLMSIR